MFNLTAVSGQTTNQDSSEISVPVNILKSYVGRYDYGQGTVNMVTLEGKQLITQLTGQDQVPVFPISADEFYPKIADARLKFVKDGNGNVISLIHKQNGMEITASKLPEEKPVTIDPAVFGKYIGKYDWGGNGLIVVSLKENKLFVQGLGLPPYQLLPASETEFFIMEANGRLTFNISEGGTSDSISVNLAGYVSTAMKVKE